MRREIVLWWLLLRQRTLRKARKTLVRFNQQFQGTAVRTDDTVVAPLLAVNLFEAGMDGHGDAVPTVVGGQEGTAASLSDTFIERISVVFM